jgi:phosphatidylserine/phosphatidylglycerophosphate/cardiolipin synthase-like enzyme
MRQRRTDHGLTVQAIAGTHVVTLGFDLTDERRAGCLGFAIQRQDHTEDELVWMRGMKTFEATDPGLEPAGTASTREHPVQGFQWADYAAKAEHDYTYRVVPLYGTPEKLVQHRTASVRVRTEPEIGTPHSVFFNRGATASQEYARRFLNQAPDEIQDPVERDAAYRWLSRGLLEALLAFIDRAQPGDAIFAAVYEFQWHTVLDALREASARGVSVHVIYDRIPGDRKPGPANFAAIQDAGIDGLCKARTHGTIMHNKFFVHVRQGTPTAVWTGSTNITESGLFGHLNCGHIVEGEAEARAFLEYWDELLTDPELAADERTWMGEHNPNPPDPWTADLTTVFSPHSGQKVLNWYRDIAKTPGKPLFMTFAFGMDKRFQEVYSQTDGVLRVALMEKEGNGPALPKARVQIQRIRNAPNVLVAIGHKVEVDSFDRWLQERSTITRNVHWVHTKFMLLDPLSADPVVITGSANFSEPSTSSNNENMLVIRGDTRVADIYLGEFMRTYSHHAFREAVAIARRTGESFRPQHLAPDASWQDEYFQPGNDRDLRRRYFAHAS